MSEEQITKWKQDGGRVEISVDHLGVATIKLVAADGTWQSARIDAETLVKALSAKLGVTS